MKKLFILQILLFTLHPLVAQQDFSFNNQDFNSSLHNPSKVGVSSECELFSGWQSIYSKSEISPQVTAMSFSLPFKIGKTFNGAGFSVIKNKVKNQNSTNVLFNYAVKKELFGGEMIFGIGLGVVSDVFDGSFYFNNGEITNPVSYDISDTDAPIDLDIKEMNFDSSIGVTYIKKDLILSLSALHLTETSFKISSKSNYKYKRNYHFYGGYSVNLNENISLKPQVAVFTNLSSMFASGGAVFDYKDKYKAGIVYKRNSYAEINSAVLLGGIELFEDLNLYYSYDVNTSRNKKKLGGNHEIVVSYSFDMKLVGGEKRFKSVRFL